VKKLPKQLLQTIAYAQNLLSFLFLDPLSAHIDHIYLFGSGARGELTAESDIDLFIDTPLQKADILERSAHTAYSRFSQSLDYQKWKKLGITYPFSVQVGKAKEWELYSSLLADGLVLYSKQAGTGEGERHLLCTFAMPSKKTQYLKLTRTLFGRREPGYRDQGILGKIGGKKLSSNVILIPTREKQTVLTFLDKEKIEYSLREICILQ